jgi:hypothetical protein
MERFRGDPSGFNRPTATQEMRDLTCDQEIVEASNAWSDSELWLAIFAIKSIKLNGEPVYIYIL